MPYVQKLVVNDSFDARGVLVPAGHIGSFDEEKISGKEKNLRDVGDFEPARVEISPIAPTGPNPKIPQQLPPDAVQGPGGQYVSPGKELVAEVTDPQESRIDDAGLRDPDAEGKVDDQLKDLMASEPEVAASASGTVAEVTADLGTKTDEQLAQIKADEEAGKNRKGVLDAVDAELAAREAARNPA
jgi:hypothetical protein